MAAIGSTTRANRLVTVVTVGPQREVLLAACRTIGVDARAAELIRAGSNTLYRLPGGIVARVGRSGRPDLADKESTVAQWLAAAGVPAVRLRSDVEQPVRAGDRAVTFWHELAPHRRATMGEIATVLRQLHSLPKPGFDLTALAPLWPRGDLSRAEYLDAADRSWVLGRLDLLHQRYVELPPGRPWCFVHGDAWAGNFVTTADGPVIVDLERFAYGPPEWDLVAVALAYVTHGTHSRREWLDFCACYGDDVTTWTGFAVLRDIRELRKAVFTLPAYKWDSAIAAQARYRLGCLRGEHGPRPWRWWPSP
jgi:aminoglycoside phosphotransferase (APT) family kinase protein